MFGFHGRLMWKINHEETKSAKIFDRIPPAAERHLILAVCFSAREARSPIRALKHTAKIKCRSAAEEARVQLLFKIAFALQNCFSIIPLTLITARRKTLDGYQRNGPDQSRLVWRPTRRAEQTIRPGVLTPAGWHIGVVELLPVHAAPIKINNPIGHQVGHGDFQGVLFLEQLFRDADSIG